MAKVTLEFDSVEDAEELESCMNGAIYKHQIEDMWKCFSDRAISTAI